MRLKQSYVLFNPILEKPLHSMPLSKNPVFLIVLPSSSFCSSPTPSAIKFIIMDNPRKPLKATTIYNIKNTNQAGMWGVSFPFGSLFDLLVVLEGVCLCACLLVCLKHEGNKKKTIINTKQTSSTKIDNS